MPDRSTEEQRDTARDRRGGKEASRRISAVLVEPWPSGGFAVRLESSAVPVSRHDTEEEALGRAAAYRRGLERERP